METGPTAVDGVVGLVVTPSTLWEGCHGGYVDEGSGGATTSGWNRRFICTRESGDSDVTNWGPGSSFPSPPSEGDRSESPRRGGPTSDRLGRTHNPDVSLLCSGTSSGRRNTDWWDSGRVHHIVAGGRTTLYRGSGSRRRQECKGTDPPTGQVASVPPGVG